MTSTTSHLRAYAIGFVGSVALTLFAFWSATSTYAVPLIVGAAVLQLIVQLYFFLHLGAKKTPKEFTLSFLLILVVIAIIIGGTLWVMSNLARLHPHQPTTDDIYEGGVVSPAKELH